MACTKTFATLCIAAKDIHPDEITTILGVSPTEILPIDPSSKYKNRRDHNCWFFSTEHLSESLDNADHLQLILRTLNGKAKELELLRRQGCAMDIFCFWTSDGQGSPYITVELMKELIDYGLDVIWDIYFDSDDAI